MKKIVFIIKLLFPFMLYRKEVKSWLNQKWEKFIYLKSILKKIVHYMKNSSIRAKLYICLSKARYGRKLQSYTYAFLKPDMAESFSWSLSIYKGTLEYTPKVFDKRDYIPYKDSNYIMKIMFINVCQGLYPF